MTAIDILAIGGCHRDLIGRTDAPFLPGTSCPGHLVETAGGVARNVAVLLASGGLGVALASRVGADGAGDKLRRDLGAAGIDTTHVTAIEGGRTGSYVALHGNDGELVAALSDMEIYDGFGADSLPEAAIAAARLVFADANLPAETLARLVALAGDRLVLDGISVAKAPRLAGAAGSDALLLLNLPSARALGRLASGDAAAVASRLGQMGFGRLVVTAGNAPLAIHDGGRLHEIAVPPVSVMDVTGAGDALAAGLLLATARGADLVAAAGIGILAAGAALAQRGALDSLPSAVLEAVSQLDPGSR